MTYATNPACKTEGEAPRLSPLEAFVAWVANLIAAITGMKRRKVFPTNWRDHWEGLRQLEWCWDQILAFSAQHVLSGKSLNADVGFQLIMEVPDDYGRACPSTSQEMNRRFILQQRFKLNPQTYILRHIQRIAKREGIALTIDASGCPLRHASHATSPALRAEEESHRRLSSSSAQHWGRWHARSCAHDGGGSRRPLVLAHARGPPTLISMFENPTPAPQTLRA